MSKNKKDKKAELVSADIKTADNANYRPVILTAVWFHFRYTFERISSPLLGSKAAGLVMLGAERKWISKV